MFHTCCSFNPLQLSCEVRYIVALAKDSLRSGTAELMFVKFLEQGLEHLKFPLQVFVKEEIHLECDILSKLVAEQGGEFGFLSVLQASFITSVALEA